MVYIKRFFDHPWGLLFSDRTRRTIWSDRARASIRHPAKSQVLSCKKLAAPLSKPLEKAISSLNREMLALKKQILSGEDSAKEHFLTARSIPDSFLRSARHLLSVCSRMLEEQRRDKLYRGLFAQDEKLPQEILQLYFDLRFWLRIAELFDERFVFFVSSYRSEVTVKLLCLDPAEMVDSRLSWGGAPRSFRPPSPRLPIIKRCWAATALKR